MEKRVAGAQQLQQLQQLYVQIEDFYHRFKTVCAETESISAGQRMPEAAQQLNGVLQETEQAASTILTAGSMISELVDETDVSDDVKQKVQQQITLIFEASSFQDISGQRIKKVMRNLQDLEFQLYNLAKAARGEAFEPLPKENTGDILLNGPQLAADAPTQADIDALFS